jgi:DNA-binding HxlR family transcriptional regulator
MQPGANGPAACSIARALTVVGERWTLAIAREAFAGANRFDDFRKRLGIARNILSARLRSLVEHGVLERRAYQQSPPRFEYRLTPMGNDLYPVLVSLLGWGDRWLAGDEGAPLTLTHRPCGHAAEPELTCGHCGDALRPEDVRAKLRLGVGNVTRNSDRAVPAGASRVERG